jgi:hypothetical protein
VAMFQACSTLEMIRATRNALAAVCSETHRPSPTNEPHLRISESVGGHGFSCQHGFVDRRRTAFNRRPPGCVAASTRTRYRAHFQRRKLGPAATAQVRAEEGARSITLAARGGRGGACPSSKRPTVPAAHLQAVIEVDMWPNAVCPTRPRRKKRAGSERNQAVHGEPRGAASRVPAPRIGGNNKPFAGAQKNVNQPTKAVIRAGVSAPGAPASTETSSAP